MPSYTANFNFTLIDYGTKPWDELEHNNWTVLDAALAAISSIPNYKGYWKNNTNYGAGQTVQDSASLLFYRCAIAHTSALLGTFASDRTANPTYWTIYEQTAFDPYLKITTAASTYLRQDDAAGTYLPTTLYDRAPYSNRNKLVDGRFDFWMEGTSTNTSGYGAATAWRLNLGSGASGSLSRQAFPRGQTDVPGDPVYFARFTRTAAGTTVSSISQRIRDVTTLAGRTTRYRFYVRCTSAINVTIRFTQNFGTGGSSSRNFAVIQATDTSWKLVRDTQYLTVIDDTSNIGSDSYLEFSIETAVGSSFSTLDIAMVQFWDGNIDAPYEYRGYEAELNRVLRLYQSTYDDNTPPGTAGALGGLYGRATTTAANSATVNWQFVIPMFGTPTITYYSPTTGSVGSCRNQTAGSDIAATTRTVNNKGASFNHAAAAAADSLLTFHAVADCRL